MLKKFFTFLLYSCSCQKCPNCGHLRPWKRGCQVCEGIGPKRGLVYNSKCPRHISFSLREDVDWASSRRRE